MRNKPKVGIQVASGTGSLKKGLLIRESSSGNIYLITKYVLFGTAMIAVKKYDITNEFEKLERFRRDRNEKKKSRR